LRARVSKEEAAPTGASWFETRRTECGAPHHEVQGTRSWIRLIGTRCSRRMVSIAVSPTQFRCRNPNWQDQSTDGRAIFQIRSTFYSSRPSRTNSRSVTRISLAQCSRNPLMLGDFTREYSTFLWRRVDPSYQVLHQKRRIFLRAADDTCWWLVSPCTGRKCSRKA
jgi:hypothetical protein